MVKHQPWENADATDYLRQMGNDARLSFVTTLHYKEQLLARGFIQSDVLYLLKNGFVYEPPRKSTDKKLYKYAIQGKTPNSEGRFARLVVIPDFIGVTIKAVTIMWIDDVWVEEDE